MSKGITAPLTQIDDGANDPENQIGSVIVDPANGREFQYCKIYCGAVSTSLNKRVAVAKSGQTTGSAFEHVVTIDHTDGYTNQPKGLLLGTPTAAKMSDDTLATGYCYGWLMRKGPLGQKQGAFGGLDSSTLTLVTNGAVAAGDSLMCSADAVIPMTAGNEDHVCGMALCADSGTDLVDGSLDCR